MTDLRIVAIVGRPNVGKSTLMNRILGRRVAIVEERPGVTRDRKEVEAEWQGTEFRLVDTGGWMPGGSALDEKVSRQSEQAIKEADALILVTDVTMGITDEDAKIAAEDLGPILPQGLQGPQRDAYLVDYLVDARLVARLAEKEKFAEGADFERRLAFARQMAEFRPRRQRGGKGW